MSEEKAALAPKTPTHSQDESMGIFPILDKPASEAVPDVEMVVKVEAQEQQSPEGEDKPKRKRSVSKTSRMSAPPLVQSGRNKLDSSSSSERSDDSKTTDKRNINSDINSVMSD
jgi:hypothetical protein